MGSLYAQKFISLKAGMLEIKVLTSLVSVKGHISAPKIVPSTLHSLREVTACHLVMEQKVRPRDWIEAGRKRVTGEGERKTSSKLPVFLFVCFFKH